jgi:hypothetical protein
MFIGVVSEALLWTLFYLYSPEITTLPDLETALYFSILLRHYFSSGVAGDFLRHEIPGHPLGQRVDTPQVLQ